MAKSQPRGRSSSAPKAPYLELAELAHTSIITKIKKALGPKAKLCIVGGTIRDILSGQKNCDIDLATALPPGECMAELERQGISVYETGLKHGTITAVMDGKTVEITTFRKPGASAFSDAIEEDLAGRDFTINAMAFVLDSEELLDPFGGEKDLSAKILRAVGKAEERFLEDPLRIMRAVRLGPAEGRTVESATEESAKKLSAKIPTVSIERIRLELEKILVGKEAAAGMRALLQYGLLRYIIPELLPSVNFEQNEFHMHDVFEHTLWVLERAARTKIQRLTALFHDIAKPQTLTVDEHGRRHFYKHELEGEKVCKEVMRRLRFSNQEIDSVSTLVRLHMRPLECGPPAVRRLMRDLGENFDDWLLFKQADAPPLVPVEEFVPQLKAFEKMVEDERNRLKEIDFRKLVIDGHDLKALGLEPGVTMGNVIRALQDLVIEKPERNTREYLLREAKKLINGH